MGFDQRLDEIGQGPIVARGALAGFFQQCCVEPKSDSLLHPTSFRESDVCQKASESDTAFAFGPPEHAGSAKQQRTRFLPTAAIVFKIVETALRFSVPKAETLHYISDALSERASGQTDLVGEKQALLSLARTMAQKPAEVLPQLVELAMTLTDSSSAGLSIYEPDPAPGVFRWRYLHGVLSPFEDATTPRNDSPCSVTLDRRRPTLSSHPEVIYDWISDAGIVVPEVLLVPLYIDGGEPIGTLWVVASSEDHFNQSHAETAAELAGFAGIALKMIQDEQRLRDALDEQELLAKEMSHRLKNLFAMADGMIRASARGAETVDELADAFSGRLHALADAHSLVQRKATALGTDKVTDLAELIATVGKAHELTANASKRITIAGPPVACSDHATNAIALMIHELATNAAKYGALSVVGGRVEIDWTIEGESLVLTWRELGGPAIVAPPARKGFGTTLITHTIERQFLGRIEQDWAATGLAMRMTIVKERLRP